MANKLKNNSGFTLIEVLIALAIFAVFIVAFITAQGYNITDSIEMRKEVQLRDFAVEKMNEILSYPPELKDSLTLKEETGKFERNDDITFTITWKKFTVPDFDKIQGTQDNEDSQNSANAVQKQIFQVVKKNLEKLLWQVQVTARDKLTQDQITISTWLTNDKYKVEINGI